MRIFIQGSSTSVDLLSKEFSEFLREKGKTIKTDDKKEYSVLPYVFERVDNSDVFIIRSLNTEYIKKEFLKELKNTLCLD